MHILPFPDVLFFQVSHFARLMFPPSLGKVGRAKAQGPRLLELHQPTLLGHASGVRRIARGLTKSCAEYAAGFYGYGRHWPG